jgi:hypothetical protein
MKNVYGVLATTLLIAACSSAPPAPAAPAQVPAPMAYAPLDRVMQAIPFANSNIIFDTQQNDPEPKPDPKAKADKGASAGKKASDDYKSVYGGWKAVENAAIALQETANLITLPRMCSNGKPAPVEAEDFRKFVKGLADAGKAAYEAAKTKDMDKMVEVSGTVSDACAACHEVYRDNGQEVRCIHKPGSDAAKPADGAKPEAK